MTWVPVSGTLPQYSTSSNELANDYYLKFYESGTTTPINMATDSTGGTLLAKCALSAEGYPITNPLDDSTRFIPHIDQNYRIVLYVNETDADNNTTANAAFNIDGMIPQIAPSADASDVVLRDTTVEIQDDYDRSPLFIDGDGFTAGAGPHVITVPTDWTPTNADMRFYRVDSSGIVTVLTPTSTSSTTFTLAETLLSTDTIFIGDDGFRDQYASRYETKVLDSTLAGAGSVSIIRIGRIVTISINGSITNLGTATSTSTSAGFLPVYARPTVDTSVCFNMSASFIAEGVAESNGQLAFTYRDWTGAAVLVNTSVIEPFTISYVV